ncbi:MAG: BatD family protein [Puia sp.]
MLIGQPIRFTIDVKSPMVSTNQLPQFDSIPHFEIIEKANPDSTISAAGASYHMEWKLTSFDSGTQVIPALTVMVGKQSYKTDSLHIEVSYGKVDTAQDYHDIKGIRDLENPDVKYIPWIVGAVAAISLFLFVWFIRQPPTPNAERLTPNAEIVRVTPLEEAMAGLEKLKQMLKEDPGSVKKYYSGLTDTLRIYLNRQLGLVTMEKTSEELILSLSNMKMDRELFSNLTETLRMGDFVKFAKYIPGPYENDTNWETIRSSIVTLANQH